MYQNISPYISEQEKEIFYFILNLNIEKKSFKDIILHKYQTIFNEIDNLLSEDKTTNSEIKEVDDNADDFFASLQNNQGDVNNESVSDNALATTKLDIDSNTLRKYLITLVFNDSYEVAMKLCMRTHN